MRKMNIASIIFVRLRLKLKSQGHPGYIFVVTLKLLAQNGSFSPIEIIQGKQAQI